jgi:hypothetical protein
MKIVLDIKGTPKKHSMLIYNGEEWETATKEQIYKEVYELQTQVASLRLEYDELKKAINKKLQDYHNILQLITKEEE